MDNHEIKQLKTELGSLVDDHKELQDPLYLFAWLRHGNFNVSAAAKSLKESYKWRDQVKIREIEELEPPATFKLSMDEMTKDGSLVVYVDFGSMDIRKEISKFGNEHLYKVFLYHFMRAEKRVMDFNRKKFEGVNDIADWKAGFKQGIVVVNVQGMALAQVTSLQAIKLALDSITSFIKYFPDLGYQLVFVKANKIFKIMFNLLEPVLRGKAKMMMFEANNSDKWWLKLDQHLDITQIPESYGGVKTVPLDHAVWQANQSNKRTKA